MLIVNLACTADSAISSSLSSGTTTSSDFVGRTTGHGDGHECCDNRILVMVLETAMTMRPRLMMLLMMNVLMETKREMVKVMVMRAEDKNLMMGRWLVVMLTSAVMARSIAIPVVDDQLSRQFVSLPRAITADGV